MKRFKGKWQEHGQFDEQVEQFSRKARNPKRMPDEEELAYQSWMNRPSDVSDYLDDEDLQSPPGRP